MILYWKGCITVLDNNIRHALTLSLLHGSPGPGLSRSGDGIMQIYVVLNQGTQGKCTRNDQLIAPNVWDDYPDDTIHHSFRSLWSRQWRWWSTNDSHLMLTSSARKVHRAAKAGPRFHDFRWRQTLQRILALQNGFGFISRNVQWRAPFASVLTVGPTFLAAPGRRHFGSGTPDDRMPALPTKITLGHPTRYPRSKTTKFWKSFANCHGNSIWKATRFLVFLRSRLLGCVLN